MKKILAVLAVAGIFVAGCSSDKPQANEDQMVVVKHVQSSDSTTVKKHHKKKKVSNGTAAKMGN